MTTTDMKTTDRRTNDGDAYAGKIGIGLRMTKDGRKGGVEYAGLMGQMECVE